MRSKVILPLLLAVGGGAYFLSQGAGGVDLSRFALPSDMQSMGGKKKDAGPDPARPETLVKEAMIGWAVTSPGVGMGEDRATTLDTLLAGHVPLSDADLPESLVPLRMPENCAFRKPRAAEQVEAVMVARSLQAAPVYSYPESAITRPLLARLKHHKKFVNAGISGEDELLPPPHLVPVGMIDLIVSRTDAPLYLVLQSREHPVLWNLQLAEGVQIAHVALLGPTASGVANLPEGTTVEGGVMSAEGACGVVPEMRLGMTDVLVRGEGSGVRSVREIRAGYESRFDKYAEWYAKTFGSHPEARLTRHFAASHILVGPPLAAEAPRIAYRPLAGAAVVLAPDDVTYAAREADHARWARARAAALLAAAFEVPDGTEIAPLIRMQPQPRVN